MWYLQWFATVQKTPTRIYWEGLAQDGGGRTRSANYLNIITQPVCDEEAQKDSSFVYSQSMLEEPDVKIPGKDGFRSRDLEMKDNI